MDSIVTFILGNAEEILTLRSLVGFMAFMFVLECISSIVKSIKKMGWK